jgi:hypothetical protein
MKGLKTRIKQGRLFIDPITNSFRKTFSSYTSMKNEKNGNIGFLFCQKTKAKSLSEMALKPGDLQCRNDYYENCFYYIHQKPFKSRNSK